MGHQSVMISLANGAVQVHGALTEVLFLKGNKDSILVFQDGTGLPTKHSLRGYDMRRERYAFELAVQLGGTDPFSLLTFGYSGTGPGCYSEFLRAAGFNETDVKGIHGPLKLMRDGRKIPGTMKDEDESVTWEDGSTYRLPWEDGTPQPMPVAPKYQGKVSFWKRLFNKSHEPSRSAPEEPRPSTDNSGGLSIETVNEASTSFVAQRAVDQLLGKTRQGKCVVLFFKGESAARQAEARRAHRVGSPQPTGLRAYTDGMVALEYPFSDQSTEAAVLDFCMLFENSGVELGVVDGCSRDTQRRILAVLGMNQGLGVG